MPVIFSGANLNKVKKLFVGEKSWTINHQGGTSNMISANSLPGTGKDHPIRYGISYTDEWWNSESTDLTFSYAAPVIYNITA